MIVSETKKKILLADDHRLFAQGLQALLQSNFEVVDVVEDGHALVRSAVRFRPDVIIADIGMPVLNGIEALRRLRKLQINSKVLMLTMYTDIAYVGQALREGADGYVLKSSAASEIVSAINEVLHGGKYIPARFTDVLRWHTNQIENHSRAIGQLTPRQREVLQLVAEGESSKQIASILNISLKTVEFHRARIMEDLDIHTVAGLTRYAIERGVVQMLP
jgi:DNA-binding NarL/FixJ family response regulator